MLRLPGTTMEDAGRCEDGSSMLALLTLHAERADTADSQREVLRHLEPMAPGDGGSDEVEHQHFERFRTSCTVLGVVLTVSAPGE